MHEYQNKERLSNIFRTIKPYFNSKLGKYTHQRISSEWHFYGLAFVQDEMTYVFGINLGVFRIIHQPAFSHIGLNVLVRTNGINSELRLKIRDFFRIQLKDWIIGDEKSYSEFRGGTGAEFPRCRPLSEFGNDEEIIEFLKSSIDELQLVYKKIVENSDGIFDHLVRASFPWHDTLIQHCLIHLSAGSGEDVKKI